ncbi:ABC transporter substrate-binding protein [Humisphaera borealis]|uniref:ABC transporter substrate-binding protein n=1 Tax=Humisphaera borealis TaxID=2807512 RepID=A0A7M2WV85_9BACT|nr:ABC transporter substrate-binding protein [Humisphaera borealis]QOV89467.1 ABC transporter substrate-binding protein [Humisphaera borealis]
MAIPTLNQSSAAGCRGAWGSVVVLCFCLVVVVGAVVGCDRRSAQNPATSPGKVTVASISPAATDLIVGMGAKDHLVAVSNFDQTRGETRDLPGVGDYRTIDWEKIAELRPAVLIVQFRADKMPTGLADRAAGYGIRLINVEINRLDHIYKALDQLGTAIGEPAKATAAATKLRAQLTAVAARVAGKPPVRTLISRTDTPLEAVGGGNFLDDVLTIAGGKNVLSGPGYDDNSYPTLDRELLLNLNPDAVLNLLPAASPQVVAKARDFWQTMPVAAQNAGQVHYLTEEYLLWPGLNVGNIAERFAAALHPEKSANEERDHHGGTETRRATWSMLPSVILGPFGVPVLKVTREPVPRVAGTPETRVLARLAHGSAEYRRPVAPEMFSSHAGASRRVRTQDDKWERHAARCPPCLRASVVISSTPEAA